MEKVFKIPQFDFDHLNGFYYYYNFYYLKIHIGVNTFGMYNVFYNYKYFKYGDKFIHQQHLELVFYNHDSKTLQPVYHKIDRISFFNPNYNITN